MRQQIKVINTEGATCSYIEEQIHVAWEAATSPDGVRPGLERVYPLGDEFVLLVFSGELAGVSLEPIRQPQEVAGATL